MKKITRKAVLNLFVCIGIIATCFILITLLSGFRHEFKKVKHFILSLVAILLIRYTFLEHLVFLLQALIVTIKGRKDVVVSTTQQGIEHEADYKRIEFLKLRVKSLKSQLNFKQIHGDEALNFQYKQLTEDLCFFTKYFFLLLLVLAYSRNSYLYYNTAITRRILNDSYLGSYKMENISTVGDLYSWISDAVAAVLNESYDYNARRIDEDGWLDFHQSQLLGVVLLQQVRHIKKVEGMTKMYFDEVDYLPGWQKLNKTLPYMDKYWRIYSPWLAKQHAGIINWLMPFLSSGSLYNYSKNDRYVTLLTRDQKNSEKILKFLKENDWLDGNTAAISMDFTIYNVDSNIFTLCSVLVEQTPFGSLLWQINVQSAELLWNKNNISMWWWLLILLYILQMLDFCKVMILRAWSISGFLKSRWDYMDFAIIQFNIMLLIFALLREYHVRQLMDTFVVAQKEEYVDFRIACFFDYVANIILGFLICLASIRLWKVLQFASIFRIFNHTLYTAGVPLLSTILGINIFLCAISKSAQILNGSYSPIFSGYLRSITSIMSFSFGFNSATSPEDLSHGSTVFGFILYLILLFGVAIFLINMFITLICEHFSNAHEERHHELPNKLTYWQFLMMEYSFLTKFCKNFTSCNNTFKDQTVRENINEHLDALENKFRAHDVNKNDGGKFRQHTNDTITKKADHLREVGVVLNLQMELLDRLVMIQEINYDLEYAHCQ